MNAANRRTGAAESIRNKENPNVTFLKQPEPWRPVAKGLCVCHGLLNLAK